MSPQEYKLISASTPEELNKLVNELIAKGFMLYGAPLIGFNTEKPYCQAVVTPIKLSKIKYRKNIPILP